MITRVTGRFGFAACLAICFGFSGMASAAQEPAGRVELVIAEDVIDRQPVGERQTFPAGQEHVVAWTRVIGLEGTTVDHVWRYEEFEFVVPLDVGSPSWRTWSRKTIPVGWSGNWSVEIRDGDGNVLATAGFVIKE